MTDHPCTCNQTICTCRDFTWRHAVLELYEPEEGWPGEGKVAEWVHDHRVGFCDGSVEDFVLSVPLAKILAWKLKEFASDIWWSLTWRFRKTNIEAWKAQFFDDETASWDALSDEALRYFDGQLDE